MIRADTGLHRPGLTHPNRRRMIQILFVDDLDGSPVDSTTRFAPDGTETEIDLNA